ncbi:MAG: hypothetical protein RDV48_03430 [Candidatus Eremiobacteraeota bacterium]|nr:hypothetical protein [Candidatus Eremiobacteraeota bacterium]
MHKPPPESGILGRTFVKGAMILVMALALVLPLCATASADSRDRPGSLIAQAVQPRRTVVIKKPATTTPADRTTTVFIGSSGKFFHKMSCKKLTGGTSLTREQALRRGYLPCPVCRP